MSLQDYLQSIVSPLTGCLNANDLRSEPVSHTEERASQQQRQINHWKQTCQRFISTHRPTLRTLFPPLNTISEILERKIQQIANAVSPPAANAVIEETWQSLNQLDGTFDDAELLSSPQFLDMGALSERLVPGPPSSPQSPEMVARVGRRAPSSDVMPGVEMTGSSTTTQPVDTVLGKRKRQPSAPETGLEAPEKFRKTGG